MGLNGFNRVAARFGIELRDPWSDRDLAEFWLRLPAKYKVRHAWRKYLTRKAFEPYLDSSVVWRRGKEHLGWEFIARLSPESVPCTSHELTRLQSGFSEYIDPLFPLSWHNGEETKNDNFAWHTPYDILVTKLWLDRVRRTNLAEK
jgi:asparagine synthetase B (glutamine-hydrolysing)